MAKTASYMRAYRARKKAQAQNQTAAFTIDPNKSFQMFESGLSQEDAVAEVGRQIANLPHEMGVLVSPEGTVFIATDGANGETVVPFEQARKYDKDNDRGHSIDRDKDYILIHNHPTDEFRSFGGPFSADDIFYQRVQGPREQRVFAKEGAYVMRIPNLAAGKEASDFFLDRYNEEAWSEYKKGGFTPNDDGYLKACHRVIVNASSNKSFEYSFIPNPGYEHLYD